MSGALSPQMLGSRPARSRRKVITVETIEARERWQRMILAALAEAGIAAPVLAEAPQ